MIKRKAVFYGKSIDTLEITEDDIPILESMYNTWKEFNDKLKKMEGRVANLPEVLSECCFCLLMNPGRYVRTNKNFPVGLKKSDCFDIEAQERLQIKGVGSKEYGPSSFGPKSEWDKLFYIDFYTNGEYNGLINIYYIDDNYLNINVNRGQTFKDQQEEKRRPRLSIMKEIIIPNNIEPIVSSKLW